jgi:ADP-heptose:LPS heptosyltransferase
MGGLGDILLMTPGLRALAAQIGGPVHFATKRAFFPILDGNPDVVLLDIDGEIALDAYERWINLSHCPAGRYEAKTRPRVRRGRVEIFARAMKVRRGSLLHHGLRPRIELDPTETDEVARLRARLGAGGRTVIGLQPYSRDTYKNYPEILTVAQHLARDHHVLVFHNFPVPLDSHPNITALTSNTLRSNIIHVKACDFFVSVDSAFYHIAAAFDVPSVGIFGPTDGALFSLHHPRHLLAPTASRFACAPCWRNEDIPCYLTGRHQSACLANVDAGAILAAVEALERRFPKRPN